MMLLSLFALCLPTTTLAQTTFQRSAKRGLVFIPDDDNPADNKLWTSPTSDLTWYYNYGVQPSPVYSTEAQSDFEFVPMLWGLSSDSFHDQITALISAGTNVSHVLTFNEPDGSASGGSSIAPDAAASAWIREVEPLRKQGVRTGAPAVTGSPGGFTWLEEFFTSCASQGTNCTADFISVHWYGDFEGLASHLGQVAGTYPNVSIWLTEYALNDQPLDTTQAFFNTSSEYLDRLPSIERYSYFGSFRSSVSNVGPNAAMLTEDGALTDIGSWYLGGAATGAVPSTATRGAAAWGVWVAVGIAFVIGALGA